MPEGTAGRRGRATPQDADRHVGAKMRERRIALGLTQRQVAEQLGITYQQANKYEWGLNRLSAGLLYRVARALGVEPGYLFEGLEAGRPAEHARQRVVLELTRDFASLPSRRHREALADLARALAER